VFARVYLCAGDFSVVVFLLAEDWRVCGGVVVWGLWGGCRVWGVWGGGGGGGEIPPFPVFCMKPRDPSPNAITERNWPYGTEWGSQDQQIHLLPPTSYKTIDSE